MSKEAEDLQPLLQREVDLMPPTYDKKEINFALKRHFAVGRTDETGTMSEKVREAKIESRAWKSRKTRRVHRIVGSNQIKT